MNKNDLDLMYRDVILDHYKNPRGKKDLEKADAEKIGHNVVCGDRVSILVRFTGSGVEDVAVNSEGCAISVASGSMLAELLPGKSFEEIEEIAGVFKDMMSGKEIPGDIDMGDLDALEGVQKFPIRIKCAMLAWETLQGLLRKWKENLESGSFSVQHEEH